MHNYVYNIYFNRLGLSNLIMEQNLYLPSGDKNYKLACSQAMFQLLFVQGSIACLYLFSSHQHLYMSYELFKED